MDIKNRLTEDKKVVEKRLAELLDISLEHCRIISESMRYSVFAGGKRIRPALFIETLAACNADYDEYIDIACAIEMIHTYSLIHDDLPAMDNDDFRRGMPTNHKKFGEDIAVLAGDALLNYAYEVLFDFAKKNHGANTVSACAYIAECAGVHGMIGGQVGDITMENKNIDANMLMYIHENKTARLLQAPVVSAGMIAELSTERISHLKDYSYHLGLAFQIGDDILDVVGDEKSLGKTLGKDADDGKNTFVKYYGVEGSKKILRDHVQECKKALRLSQLHDDEFLTKIADYLLYRNN